jgi:hypothetical protein
VEDEEASSSLSQRRKNARTITIALAAADQQQLVKRTVAALHATGRFDPWLPKGHAGQVCMRGRSTLDYRWPNGPPGPALALALFGPALSGPAVSGPLHQPGRD